MQTIVLNRGEQTSSGDIRIIDGNLELVVTRQQFDNAMMLLVLLPDETVKIIKIIRAYSSLSLREAKAIYDAVKQVKAEYFGDKESYFQQA